MQYNAGCCSWKRWLVVALLLAAQLPGAEGRLRRVHEREDPPPEGEEEEDSEGGTLCRLSPWLCKAGKAAGEAVKKTADAVARAVTGEGEEDEEEPKTGKDGKPLMKRVDMMRTELCWDRHNLHEHLECLEYLGIHCDTESTGKGICTKFKALVHDECLEETEPALKKRLCEVAEYMDVIEHKAWAPAPAPAGQETEQPSASEPAAPAAPAPAASPAASPAAAPAASPAAAPAASPAAAPLAAPSPAAAPAPGPAPALHPTGDEDGDGFENQHDAFPRDPKEHKDLDADGIGDNSDPDRDGDGHENEKDAFPDDPKRWKRKDSKIDAKGKEEPDRDGDGVPDKEDAFPDDPSEWKDSDGDGVGDNADAYPFNKDCYSKEKPCSSYYNKVRKPLPPQGYDEFRRGAAVEHGDDTVTGDWRREWPMHPESTKESIARICREHPKNAWCKAHGFPSAF